MIVNALFLYHNDDILSSKSIQSIIIIHHNPCDDNNMSHDNQQCSPAFPFCLPSGNQTWQGKMDHLSVIFLIKPPLLRNLPLPCLFTGMYPDFLLGFRTRPVGFSSIDPQSLRRPNELPGSRAVPPVFAPRERPVSQLSLYVCIYIYVNIDIESVSI